LKEEAIDRAVGRTGCRRGCGHVLKQTTLWMVVKWLTRWWQKHVVRMEYTPYIQKFGEFDHKEFINVTHSFYRLLRSRGHAAGGAVGWCTALQTGRSRGWFPVVSLEFLIGIILPAALWPWGWLSL
jgi:hypothetical protein